MTVRVKVCGITRLEDAQLACELGTACGRLVFWGQSPRYVTPSRAREIVAALPEHVLSVGVFVNPSESEARSIADGVARGIQLHGDETIDLCERLPYPVDEGGGARGCGECGDGCRLPDAVTVLLDVHDPGESRWHGATGRLDARGPGGGAPAACFWRAA